MGAAQEAASGAGLGARGGGCWGRAVGGGLALGGKAGQHWGGGEEHLDSISHVPATELHASPAISLSPRDAP